MKSIMPVLDKTTKNELENILNIYESDNINSWEMQPAGICLRQDAGKGEHPIIAQDIFASLSGTAKSFKAKLNNF